MRALYDFKQEENELCLLHAQALREAAQRNAHFSGRAPGDHEINRRYTEADKESLQTSLTKTAARLYENHNNELYFSPIESLAAVHQFTRAHLTIATENIQSEAQNYAGAFAHNSDDTSNLINTTEPHASMRHEGKKLFTSLATQIGLNNQQIEKTFNFMQDWQLIA